MAEQTAPEADLSWTNSSGAKRHHENKVMPQSEDRSPDASLTPLEDQSEAKSDKDEDRKTESRPRTKSPRFGGSR
jgi:hypothetical protein